ncbi:MAG TPA: hypothetical protein PLM59_05020 [Oscillospiraceae bacterium]|jgi:hypothetical protein|nr:hypothetical protein [Oscillospiraceae bacterium]
MLEIHQRENIENYIDYFKKYNIPDDANVVEAFDKGNVTGFAIYKIKEDAVFIYHVEYGDDLYLCDGIVRTVLFKASMLGINKAKFEAKDLSAFKKLGFLEKESDWLISIESVMDGCKKCKNSC